jgi:acetylornithine deacetylase/succinyl-diaminopimelate desuccinylase-like protein
MHDPVGRVRVLIDELAPARHRLEAADDALVARQIAIAEIPAPTGREERRARWTAARLRDLGTADVHVDDAGNVVALRRGTRDDAPLVVCAHLDTVFETDAPITVQRSGARLSAPGIGDNARGLATLLALAAEFGPQRRMPGRPIVFAATTGEEGPGNLRGARHLFETAGRDAHAAIAIDGAGDERVVACALGCRRFRIELRGPGGHSWAAYGAPNAVHAAGALVTRLASLAPRQARTTLSVARIGGGTAVNAIPAHAWLEVDVRSTEAAELVRLDRALREAVLTTVDAENARRSQGSAPLEASIALVGERPAGEIDAASPLVQAALEATRCIGRAPELAIASTDANIPISRGIPAIAIGGGGRGGDTHTPHEWFENHEGSRGVLRALLVVAAMAS